MKIKGTLLILAALSLILAPYALSAGTSSSGPAPIEQPLVREGDFAVSLANSLDLTTSNDEATAEDALSSIGIGPRNGWISDYPVTPDIIEEVRASTARAASANDLQMAQADAASVVDKISIGMNLPVKMTESSGGSQSLAPPAGTGLYDEGPENVQDYYDEYESPVVTYYPPPWDYYWLYDWVPSPFWWNGIGFGGFFVLIDFDVYRHHHHFSNHFRTAGGTWSRVNPVTRSESTSLAAGANRTGQASRIHSPSDATAARPLVNRSTGTQGGSTVSASARDRDRSPGNTGRIDQQARMPAGGMPHPSAMSPSYSGRGSGGGFRGGGFHGGGHR